jgi:hypothetical protein
MPSEKKKRIIRVKKRIGGLRLKLVLIIMVLVLLVNVIASIPLHFLMVRNQSETLYKGLWDRATVLLEVLAANASLYFFHGNMEEMKRLPAQMGSIPEALYVTITGYNPETLVFDDRVWATNDPNILRKIDSPELIPGFSRINDALSPRVPEISAELNVLALERVSGVPREIARLNQEAQELLEQTRRSNSPDIARRLADIQSDIRILEGRITNTLTRIGGGIRSEPEYSTALISQNRRYLFYKPVLMRFGAEDEFFWGIVRLEVSVNPILSTIDEGLGSLLRVNLFVFLIAQIVGAVGALLLSNYILKPIGQLLKHVETIRDTQVLKPRLQLQSFL